MVKSCASSKSKKENEAQPAFMKRVLILGVNGFIGHHLHKRILANTDWDVYGPINKQRWIYACSKQLMDRVIWAYGEKEGLDFTLFRPFNWIGSGLDSLATPKEGSSRVVTQFFGHIVRGERINLVDGGRQKRAFTYIDDGIDALMAIIANKAGIASRKIFNVGNPKNNISVRELAESMVKLALEYPEDRAAARKVRIVKTTADRYYGRGYQDVQIGRASWR